MDLLAGYEILQVDAGAPAVSQESIDFAGQIARQMGAKVYTSEPFEGEGSFLGRGKVTGPQAVANPVCWARAGSNRVLLVAGGTLDPGDFAGTAAVLLNAEASASEATWFAESGIADLLGDVQRAPIIPSGQYASGTASYAVVAALCVLVTKLKRFGVADIALLDGAGVLAWVNWKAAAQGELGSDIHREGGNAEWPVVQCADGYVALVYQQRDWNAVVEMIGDDRLRNRKFRHVNDRALHRHEYMSVIRDWAANLTKRELAELFLKYEIPAAPVMDERDLLADPLLSHRKVFAPAVTAAGGACRTPRLAHRFIEMGDAPDGRRPAAEADATLPLAGVRVLDLGIITAGAGVGAFLADLGAEVLKVESHSYPDPFRQWTGETVSPLFKCNNRNKYGLSIDLKTDAGRAQFRELVGSSDMVLENFRRGVLDRLGFDYETLRAINPQIVLASISGQGLEGPGSEATSFGSTLEASSGFSANVRYPDGMPHVTGRNLNYPDQTIVLYAGAVLTAILGDLGRGCHVDVSQRDAAVFLAGNAVEQLTSGQTLNRRDNGACYRARDGQWIAIRERDAIEGVPLTEWVAARRSQHALRVLKRQGCCAARVNPGSEMFKRFATSYQFATSPDGGLVKGFPFQLVESPLTIRLNSPEVGEHTVQFCPNCS